MNSGPKYTTPEACRSQPVPTCRLPLEWFRDRPHVLLESNGANRPLTVVKKAFKGIQERIEMRYVQRLFRLLLALPVIMILLM